MEQKRLPLFAERFAELRGNRTQAEFADFLGLSRPTIGFYENGSRIPDALVLRQIAEKCSVSTDWLIGISDFSKADISNRTAAELGLSEKAAEYLTTVYKSSREDREPEYSSLKYLYSDAIELILNDEDRFNKHAKEYGIFDKEKLRNAMLSELSEQSARKFDRMHSFQAKITLDALNLLLEVEEEYNILQNLSIFIYSRPETEESIYFTITEPDSTDIDVKMITEASCSIMDNALLIEAESALKDLKRKFGRYIARAEMSHDSITIDMGEEPASNTSKIID